MRVRKEVFSDSVFPMGFFPSTVFFVFFFSFNTNYPDFAGFIKMVVKREFP